MNVTEVNVSTQENYQSRGLGLLSSYSHPFLQAMCWTRKRFKRVWYAVRLFYLSIRKSLFKKDSSY